MAYGEQRDSEPSKKAWSVGGTLFNGDTNSKVHMQCDFQGDPQFYTVQFSLTPIFTVPQQVAAEILWSVEGVTNRRLISVLNGASISGCGQSVAVNVFDLSAIGGGPEEYQVNATVTKGTRASAEQPPILELTADAQGNIGRFAVPTVTIAGTATATSNFIINAGITAIYFAVSEATTGGAPITSEDVFVQFFSGLNGTGVMVKQLNYNGCNQWVSVPPSAKSVSVTNNRAPADTIQVTRTFGVDG